jgi:rRNA maturation RNase YbeY
MCSEYKKREVKSANIILLNDEAIRDLNNESLGHDYYTDIITFDLSEDVFHVETDIYISFERVKENAQINHETNKTELLRVILHGFLHLMGLKDKTKLESKDMRQAENKYINFYLNGK